MITIGKPRVEIGEGNAYLKARVTVDDRTAETYARKTAGLKNCCWLTSSDYPPAAWRENGGELWFRVPTGYTEHLTPERSDAFVVAMFWYAMLTGSDIEFETPMSKRLHAGLTEKLMPVLAAVDAAVVRLVGPVSEEALPCAGAVGTGMSCGVDSFYTMVSHGADSDEPLTHLTHYSDGNIIPPGSTDVEGTYAKFEETIAAELRKAEMVAEGAGLPLVPVRTNLDRDFYRGGQIYTAMYRHLACTLALGRLFGTYLSSSSGHGADLGAKLIAPTQNYERLICGSCRTESLEYVSSDDVSRMEKLKAVADNPLFQRYASVCFNDCACGECIGCWKTLFPLDILGKLDRFAGLYDLQRYYAHREGYVREFVKYATWPQLASVKVTLEQIVRLAESEPGDSARRFREILRAAMRPEA